LFFSVLLFFIAAKKLVNTKPWACVPNLGRFSHLPCTKLKKLSQNYRFHGFSGGITTEGTEIPFQSRPFESKLGSGTQKPQNPGFEMSHLVETVSYGIAIQTAAANLLLCLGGVYYLDRG